MQVFLHTQENVLVNEASSAHI